MGCLARGAPSISHLFLANDNLLFCDASVLDCINLREIFRLYEESSGQKINNEKSAMCFSPCTSSRLKDACRDVLNMVVVPCHERFLRLPTVTGKDKRKLFQGLSYRIYMAES